MYPIAENIVQTINRRIIEHLTDVDKTYFGMTVILTAAHELSIVIRRGDECETLDEYFVYKNYGAGDEEENPAFYDLKNVILHMTQDYGYKFLIRNLKYYVPPRCKSAWIYSSMQLIYSRLPIKKRTWPDNGVSLGVNSDSYAIYNGDHELIFITDKKGIYYNEGYEAYEAWSRLCIDFEKPFTYGDYMLHDIDLCENTDLKFVPDRMLAVDSRSSMSDFIRIIKHCVDDLNYCRSFSGFEDCFLKFEDTE